MQLAKDGRIILDLDETAEANCIGAQLESSPLRRESHIQVYLEERRDLTPFPRIELFTIQYGSLELVVMPLMVQTPPLKIKPTVYISEDDEGGGPLLLEPKTGLATTLASEEDTREEEETSTYKK